MLTRKTCLWIAAALLVTEVLIAAFLHDAVIRPHVGDALATALVYFAIRGASPVRLPAAVLISLAIAITLEFAQGWGLLARLGLSGYPLARIILGGSFDPTDFIAYAVGAIAAAAVDLGVGVSRRR